MPDAMHWCSPFRVALMFAAAQTPLGAAVMVLGVLVEIAGIALDRRRR